MKNSIKVLVLTIVMVVAMAIPCMASDILLEQEILKENNPCTIDFDGYHMATQREGQNLEDKFLLQMLEADGVQTVLDYNAWKMKNGMNASTKYALNLAQIRAEYQKNKALMYEAYLKGDNNLCYYYMTKLL